MINHFGIFHQLAGRIALSQVYWRKYPEALHNVVVTSSPLLARQRILHKTTLQQRGDQPFRRWFWAQFCDEQHEGPLPNVLHRQHFQFVEIHLSNIIVGNAVAAMKLTKDDTPRRQRLNEANFGRFHDNLRSLAFHNVSHNTTVGEERENSKVSATN